jgi:hypothetical protein
MSTKKNMGLNPTLSTTRKICWKISQELIIKLKETRANLSPAKLVQGRIFLLSGVTLGLGFALGYRGVPIEEIGRPVARTISTTAGKQTATRQSGGR